VRAPGVLRRAAEDAPRAGRAGRCAGA